MKLKIFFIISLLFFSWCIQANKKIISIKRNNIQVDLLQSNGFTGYEIRDRGKIVLAFSRLGLKLRDTDLSTNLKFISNEPVKNVSETYNLITGKKIHDVYRAKEINVRFQNNEKYFLNIVFRVSDNGVAFRYEIENNQTQKNKSKHFITKEITSFNFPPESRAWLSPREKGGSGWCRTQPSYEENYQQEIPVGTKSVYGEGWTFPALFKSGKDWLLLSETAMPENYCGAHLSEDVIDGEYSIAFPDSVETKTGELAEPNSTLNWKSPWRMIIISDNLKDIVESTLSTDLAPDSEIGKCNFAKPGIAAWSWALLKDSATINSVQKKFIDYAASMKWSYCLIDGFWDTQIGFEKIRKLADYAATKNVGIWLWYNSAGKWNDTPITPRNRLLDSISRDHEFSSIHSMGIKGIKVDFFPGDGQSVMKYQQDILKDAAKYELMVNFHGSTFPRGYSRTFPNLMTTEAVKGFEYRTFSQQNENVAANHCCMLPFTRNVVASMDFTPVCFSEIPGIKRQTSNAFELALSVIFESGVQHIVETPEGMSKVPDYVRNFLTGLPTAWDDIKYIAGYPGKYVIIARKKNNKWYVAGINAQNSVVSQTIDVSFMHQPEIYLIADGSDKRSFSLKKIKQDKIKITLQPQGGLVLY